LNIDQQFFHNMSVFWEQVRISPQSL